MLTKHSLLCTFFYRKSNTIQLFNELGANCRGAFTNLLGLRKKHETLVRYNPTSNIGGNHYNLEKEFNKSTPGSFRDQKMGTKTT